MAVSTKRIYVGASQSNLVQAYSWEGDSEGVTTRYSRRRIMITLMTDAIMIMMTSATLTCRFTADVTCLAVSGELLAAGSADMTLKVGWTLVT